MKTAGVLLVTAGAFPRGRACNPVSAPPFKFEVADVHVSPLSPDYHKRTMGGSMLHRDQFEVHRATMVNLISIAWGIDEAKVTGGPNWLENGTF
jgi:uncharacterized protein (TIGR03435 family)